MKRQALGLLGWAQLFSPPPGIGAWASIDASNFIGPHSPDLGAPGPRGLVRCGRCFYVMMALAAWLVWRPGGFWKTRWRWASSPCN